jgi:hypothetical protein
MKVAERLDAFCSMQRRVRERRGIEEETVGESRARHAHRPTASIYNVA